MCVYFFFFLSAMREGPQLEPRTNLANHDHVPQPFLAQAFEKCQKLYLHITFIVWVFNWLHGWVYVNTLSTFFHLQHVLLQKGNGQGKGKGMVKGEFSKRGADSTVIEAVEGDIASLQRYAREIADESDSAPRELAVVWEAFSAERRAHYREFKRHA